MSLKKLSSASVNDAKSSAKYWCKSLQTAHRGFDLFCAFDKAEPWHKIKCVWT